MFLVLNAIANNLGYLSVFLMFFVVFGCFVSCLYLLCVFVFFLFCVSMGHAA